MTINLGGAGGTNDTVSQWRSLDCRVLLSLASGGRIFLSERDGIRTTL